MKKIKKGMALILSVVMMITMLPATALATESSNAKEQDDTAVAAEEYTYYEEDGWTIRNDGIITVAPFNSYMEIPSMIAGYTVKGIRDGLFSAFPTLQSVTFPEGMEYIGNTAFTQCKALKEVNFPSSLTYIGERAFEATALSGTVVLPKGITEISDKAFSGTNISSVIIKGEVTTIGEEAFRGCRNLITMDLPDSVTKIESRAFDQCTSYKAVLPESVTSLGEYAFCGTLIEEAKLSEVFTQIPRGLFKDCKNLTTVEMQADSIAQNAFQGCERLNDVNLGDNLTYINQYAFAGCSSLDSIIIPNGVTDIMGYAFAGTSLKTVRIPENVSWLQGNLAFSDCETLEYYSVAEENDCFFARDGVLYSYAYGVYELEHYPMGKKEFTSYTLPNDIGSIAPGAFANNKVLKQIIIQDNPIFEFYKSSFKGLSELMEVKVDSTISFYNKSSDGDDEGTLMDDFENIHKFTIYGEKGSSAQEFAEKYGYPFRTSDQFQLFANNVPDDRIQITILDEDGYPLEGATVKVDESEALSSDENGVVEFTDDAYKKVKQRKIGITLDGYNTKVIFRKIGFGIGISITLKKSDGKPYIISAVLDDTQDLLSQKVIMEKTEKSEKNDELVVTADFGEGEEKIYEIYQGGYLKGYSTNGTFSVDLSTELSENESVYLRVGNTAGDYSDFVLLSLSVLPRGTISSLPYEGEIEISEDWEVTLPDNLPPVVKQLAGGTNIKHELFEKFPAKISVDQDGKVRVAINMDKEEFKNIDEFEDFYNSVKKKNGDISKRKLKKNYDGQTLNKLEIKGKLMGYGEGYITHTVDGELVIAFTAGIIGELEGEGVRSRTFIIHDIPFYIKGNFKAKGNLEHNQISGMISTDDNLPPLKISYYGDAKTEIDITGGVGGGVGYYRHLSAGITGGVTFDIDYRWQAKALSIAAIPNLGYEAYVAGFEISKDYLGDYVRYQIWPREEAVSVVEESDNSVMQRMSRSYAKSYSERTTDEGTTITGVYPNAQPKQVSFGDKTYLFWLEDVPERADINRSCLVYAVVNSDGTLGEKKAVEDDGTADFDFQVAADDQGIYVVWQDAKDVLGSETTMTQQLNNLELSAGAFDIISGEWSIKNITGSTTCLNMNPMLSLSSEKICVSWDTLDGEDYFSEDAVAESRYVEMDKTLTTTVSKNYTAEGCILYTAMGSVAGKNVYAYITDSDRDLNTFEDRKIQIIDLADPDNVWKTLNVSANTLQFAKLNGTDALFIGCDEALCYTEDLENIVTIDKVDLSGAEFKVSEDVSGKTYVYYQISRAKEDKTRYYIYMNTLENGSWSDAQVVYESENSMRNLCINQGDGNILIMFMETVDGITSLRTINANDVQVFSITDVLCEEETNSYGQPVNLHIQIDNPGKGATEISKVEVLRGAESIYTKSYEDYMIEAGAQEVILLDDFVIPEDLTGPEEFTVKVHGTELTEEKILTLGYTDLKVEVENYLDNGVDMLGVNVSNLSQMTTAGTVRIYRVEDLETTVYEREFSEIASGKTQNMTFNIDNLKSLNDITSLYIEVTADKEEEFKEDNAAYAVVSVFGQGETEPKKLSLDKNSLVLYVGEDNVKLTPSLTPVSVENPEYIWKSSNETIVSVDENGGLKAIKPGIASITCAYGDLKTSCTVKVRWDSEYEIVKEVTDWKELESEHNYTYHLNKTWVYTDDTRDSIAVKFNYASFIPSGDMLYVLDGNNQIVESLDGYINNKIVSVEGNTIKLKLVTDGSLNGYGFKVCQIADNVENGSMVNLVTDIFESDHSYAIPYDTTWIYELEDTQALKIKFSEDSSVDKGNWQYEASHLYLYDMEGNLIEDLNNSEKDLAGREVVVQGDGFKLQLSAPEGCCTDYGFRIEKIEAVEAGVIEAGEHGDNLKWSLSELGVLKIEGTGEMEETNSYSYPWMEYSDSVKKVVICEGVESISDNAFRDMFNVEEFKFPSTLKRIGTSAFAFCKAVRYFELPKEMTEIEDWAFDYTSYEEMALPDTVETVGDYAFSAKYGRVFHVSRGSQMDEHMLAKGFKNYLSYEDLSTPEIEVTSDAIDTVSIRWDKVLGAQQYEVYRVENGKRILLSTVDKWPFKDTENITKGQTYTYQVRAFKTIRGEKYYSEYSGSKSFTYEGPAVQGLYAYVYNSDKIRMYWNEMDGAINYEIYYSMNEDGLYKKLATIDASGELEYVHEGVKAGRYHYYKVRAKIGDNEYSSFSEVSSCKTTLSATKVTVSVKDAESLTINWEKIPDADGYVIYRALQGETSLSPIKTIENPDTVEYVDSGLTMGQTYQYIVRGYVLIDGEKEYGNYLSAVTGTPVLVLTAPTVKAASAGYNSIKISWNKVGDANGYIVYRSTSKTGTFTGIKTITNGSTLSFTNTGLTCGKTYYYMVRAYVNVNGERMVSDDSSICSATPKLTVPTVTLKSAGYNKIKVSWTKVTGANGYEIYRATSKTAAQKLVKTVTSGSTLSFTNGSLTCGKNYYYTVKAYRTVNGKKVYSGSSTKKYAKPVPATPTATLTKKSSTSITVKWTKVTGANGYEIYRATSKNGTYKKIKTVTKGATVSYVNTGCKKSTRYYYKVRAYRTVSGKKVFGSYSAVKNLKL